VKSYQTTDDRRQVMAKDKKITKKSRLKCHVWFQGKRLLYGYMSKCTKFLISKIKNISVISWQSVLLLEETLEKTTDLPQVSDKL
jgi:hypothetical protein